MIQRIDYHIRSDGQRLPLGMLCRVDELMRAEPFGWCPLGSFDYWTPT